MRIVQNNFNAFTKTAIFGAAFVFAGLFQASAHAQLPPLPGETAQQPPSINSNALPPGPNEAFSFDDSETLDFESAANDQKEQARKDAFDAALEGMLPLRPEEIRALLERFDRTQESVETPVYPNPKPEVVVQNITLDPGAPPATIKLAYGHVTTVNFLDTTGAPWPVQDISWAGNFEIINNAQAGGEGASFTHMFRISPQSEFAYGNMSITLTSLRTPVIITLETNRDVVHYRFDAVVPDYGPLAEAPLIETGISTSAGSTELSSILEGIAPQEAERLNVSGVDGRTSAYRYNDVVYVRTPLTLLSPGWSSSSASADGMRVYEINDAPVLLLSDKGRMVRARLSDRIDILEEIADE
ncbi:MAG: DotH/IcmK family type IV secretion protein [Pseudomonadota bacterium]